MSDRVLEGLTKLAPLIGFICAGLVLVLIAELDYRWSVHSMQRKSFPHEKHESFVKYLFMAWFVRSKKWYARQERKHRQ